MTLTSFRRAARKFLAGSLATASVVGALWATETPVAAQPPSGDFRGGRDRDRGDSGRRRMFDPGEMVSRLDQNGNGQIDVEEMQGPARFFLDRAARDNNLDLTKPIPTAKLREIMQARMQGGSSGGSSGSSSSGSSSSTPPKTTIAPNAFGVEQKLTPVPGFGPAATADSWDVIKAKYGQRIVERVEEMLARMDKNKDGILDAEEIKGGQWRGDPKDSDLNKDGNLSRSELAERQRLREQSGGGFPGGGFPGGGFSGGSFPGGGFGGGFPSGGYDPGGSMSRGSSSSSSAGGSSGSSSSGSNSKSASTNSYGPTRSAAPIISAYRNAGAATASPSGAQSYSVASNAAPTGATSTSSGSTSTAPSGTATPSAPSATAPAAAIPQPVLDFAESTIKENDANGNGTLDPDEVSKMSSRRRKADVNGDGKITKDELIAYQMGFQSAAPSTLSSSSSSGSSSTTSGASSRSVTYGGRTASTKGIKTYRFLAPIERLPQGLPDWFVRSDANGDGQVSMGEFSPSYDDAKAAEFARWDRNGDGLVTSREATSAK